MTKIIGQSRAIQDVIQLIETFAPGDETVLILGETGTGKELVAREIHENSPRFDKKFWALNCAALPEDLLDSELFGYEKGAFTGAGQRKKGLFEEADHSTLFLDEIGDASPYMQAKLLRALQEHKIRRVGGTAEIKVNVRVIAATHHPLRQRVKEGTFREDLLFRLNVHPIKVPPLRERKKDIPLLVDHFLAKLCEKKDIPRKIADSAAVEELGKYHWPGNVRELEAAVTRALVFAIAERSNTVFVKPPLDDLEDGVAEQIKRLADSLEARDRDIFNIGAEREFKSQTTADILGLTRQGFWKMLGKPNKAKLRRAWIEAQQLFGRRISERSKYDLSKRGEDVELADALKADDAIDWVPHPVRDFIGRQAEINELVSAARKGGLILYGMAGVGKTELALKIAELLKNEYPVQLYFDLEGTSPRPLGAADAMSHVIQCFGRTTSRRGRSQRRRPLEIDADLVGRFRSVLHGEQVILLMDNAQDEVQIQQLQRHTPPETCILLVTSRWRLVLPGLYPKNLQVLSPAEACDLLLKIAERIDGEAEAIAELCGYLPLALRAAASTLARRTDMTPADYIRQLTDAQKRLGLVDPWRNVSVEACLGLSYNFLSLQAQVQFRSLGVFPEAFEVAAAAAVLGCEPDVAKNALGELMKCGLLEFNGTTQRYRMHDLVHVFAKEFLTGTEREMVQRLHAEHYKDVAERSESLYLTGGDVEWKNIKAGLDWATEHASHDNAAARLCSDYVLAGESWLEPQPPLERIRWGEAALAAVRAAGDLDAECRCLDFLGLAYSESGDPRKAKEQHERELAIASKTGNPTMEAYALNGLGFDSQDLDEVDHAIECYDKALAIFSRVEEHEGKTSGARIGKGYVLGNLGVAYMTKGDFASAIARHKQALDIDVDLGYRRGEAQDLCGLGHAYTAWGKPDEAIGFHQRALVIAGNVRDRNTEALCLSGLGDAYTALREFQAAREFYERAIGIDRKWGNRGRESVDRLKLAKTLHHIGDRPQAIAHADAALGALEEGRLSEAEEARRLLSKWRQE